MALLQNIRLTSSLIFLILVNLIPVFGVLVLNWDIATIMLLYWLETLIIGGLNIIKMWACEGSRSNKIGATFFFMFHFGMFTGVHLVFLFAMFGVGEALYEGTINGTIFWAAGSLLVSHAFSMVTNFFGRREYEGRSVTQQMGYPYGRVVVMHIVIIFGGIGTMVLGSPIVALVLLIGLKIVMDVIFHLFVHRDAPVQMAD